MAFVTRLLVLANRTADSDELFEELRRRAPVRGTLVIPAPLGHESEARGHLDRVLTRLRGGGIDLKGAIGDADPVNAALDAWDPLRFDEILVCTLPPGESTWLHIDLPHRLRRLTDATVSHVIAREPVRTAAAPLPVRERQPWFARLFPLSQRRVSTGR